MIKIPPPPKVITLNGQTTIDPRELEKFLFLLKEAIEELQKKI